MSIEIDTGKGRPPPSAIETGQPERAGNRPDASAGSGASAPPRADTFSMTNRAAQLQRLEAQIENLPVVDTQRVEDVQRSLATGSFEVQPARVADKLLQFEAGLDKPS